MIVLLLGSSILEHSPFVIIKEGQVYADSAVAWQWYLGTLTFLLV